jgi:carboxypeptidase C (cathepsin A)
MNVTTNAEYGSAADAEYTFARHGILKDRVTTKYYEAGHMMYLREPDVKSLALDIREFLTP